MLLSQRKMTINLISAQLSKSINLIQSWKFLSLKKKKKKKKNKKIKKIKKKKKKIKKKKKKKKKNREKWIRLSKIKKN